MKINTFVAILLAAVTTIAVACTEKPENHDTQDADNAKISRIYMTSDMVIENYNDSTGTWDTLRVVHSDRELWYEFHWSGDRLASFTTATEEDMLMIYDSDGRLAEVDGGYMKFRFHYDADGHLANYVRWTMPDHEYVITDTMVCTYSGNHLTTIEHTYLGTGIGQVAHTINYGWSGNNVSHMEAIVTYADGDKDTVDIDYTYTTHANPLFGLPPFSIFGMVFHIYSDSYTHEGMSANMASNITSNESGIEWIMDYTLDGQRVKTGHVVYTTNNANGRSVTDTRYEFEYTE